MKSTGLRIVAPLFLAMLLWGSLNDAANSCGFDSPLGDGFSAMHPRSIAVAVAIRDAVDAGVVEHSVLDPIVPGAAGYWRAVQHLNALQRLVAAGRTATPSPISVLFIDSNLWSRLSPSLQGLDIAVHMADKQPGDAVIVTSEAILAAVLDDRLPIAAALDYGLIAIEGAEGQRAEIRQIIVAALTLPNASIARETLTHSRPARLFGAVLTDRSQQ